MLSWVAENLKLLGTSVVGVMGISAGYVAIDGPIPASTKFVLAQSELHKTQNKELNVRVIDQQLQLNMVQRNLLRKEKFDRELELSRDVAGPVRSILQQRKDQIEDELDTIEKEREVLRKEKAAR